MLVRNRKTQTYLALLLFFFALLMPLQSYAAQNSQQQISTQAVKTGWVQTGEKWKYVNKDGSYPKNTWKYLYSTWYYFDEDGWMVTGWKEINEETYYLRPSGAMVVGWVKLEGKYYYFNPSGVLQKNGWVDNDKYYVDENGVWIEDKTKDEDTESDKAEWLQFGKRWKFREADGSYAKGGWKNFGGSWYYFDANGWMAVGWLETSGNWYYLDPKVGNMQRGWKKINDSWYYLNPGSGELVTGWNVIGGSWYYLDPGSGEMAEGWTQIKNEWYYLKPDSGVMLENWQKIDGAWYYLNPGSGTRAQGWKKIGSTWYYLDATNGQRQKGWTKVNNAWYYLNDNGIMAEGWMQQDTHWYYLKPGNGSMAIGWQNIGGTWYYLDGAGVMVTGWHYIGNHWYYMTGSGAMATNWLKLNNNWYYVGSNGAMVTGWQDIADKRYYFYDSGVMAASTKIDGIEIDADGVAQIVSGPLGSLTRLLKTAILPVGNTLYVWGGGHDLYIGGDSLRIGVNPQWKKFYDRHGSNYDFSKYRYSYGNGLDCSGFIGWTIYNTYNTKANQSAYVTTSTKFPSHLAEKGLGTYKTVSGGTFTPGDVVAIDGHVWMVIGMCSDGSVVIVHATPPVIQISGTVTPSGSNNSEAVQLAQAYMKKYFSDAANKFNLCIASSAYLNNVKRFQWYSNKLTDPDGLRNLSAEQVLAKIIGPK